MANEGQYTWVGNSGKSYTYWIFPIDQEFEEGTPANYIFAKQARGQWTAIYIGQTSQIGRRMTGHDEEECAKRNGATHIHAHEGSPHESVRKDEENDLIKRHNPPCNG